MGEDVSDAAWLAQLGAHGLLHACRVPPENLRLLHDLTRTRTAIKDERCREIQRLEKMLEDSGIKLSSVATDIIGVSGRAMLQALIEGQNDPAVLADLAKTRMRRKIPAMPTARTSAPRHGSMSSCSLLAPPGDCCRQPRTSATAPPRSPSPKPAPI